MVEETGIVVEKKRDTVLIKAARTSGCDSCASKKSCHSGGSADDMLIEADNSIGAKPGDKVVFTVGAASIFKAGLMLYLVPMVFFICGIILGQAGGKRYFPEWNHDLASGVLGVIFLGAAFVGLKIYSRILEKNNSYKPHVLRVI